MDVHLYSVVFHRTCQDALTEVCAQSTDHRVVAGVVVDTFDGVVGYTGYRHRGSAFVARVENTAVGAFGVFFTDPLAVVHFRAAALDGVECIAAEVLTGVCVVNLYGFHAVAVYIAGHAVDVGVVHARTVGSVFHHFFAFGFRCGFAPFFAVFVVLVTVIKWIVGIVGGKYACAEQNSQNSSGGFLQIQFHDTLLRGKTMVGKMMFRPCQCEQTIVM